MSQGLLFVMHVCLLSVGACMFIVLLCILSTCLLFVMYTSCLEKSDHGHKFS